MNPFAVEARIRDLADQAATEFLSPLSEKRASPEYISKHADKILKDAGANLTSVVVKIAQDENLNAHEVARVCEEANKEVFGRLYKGSDDKTFEFSVADAKAALTELNRPYEGPGDIFLPVEHPKHASEKTAGYKTAASETSWARTALYPSTQQAIRLQMQQEKDARDAFGETRLEAQAAGHQAALDFVDAARSLIFEKEATASEIFSMVREARPGSKAHEKVARELLAFTALTTNTRFPEGADLVVKYASALISTSETGGGGNVPSDDLRHVTPEQYEFWTKSPGQQTDAYFDKNLSSSGDPVRMINGHHKLFVTLDTLIDQSNKEGYWNKGLLFAQDRVRAVARNVVNWMGRAESVE